MERDFLGLNSRDSLMMVKEETKDGCEDSAFTRGSGMQWPHSNKVSTLAAEEDRNKKIACEPLASSGFMPIATTDAIETNHKPAAGLVQKNLNLDRQGSTHYAMTAYPVHHVDAHSVHRPHESRMFPVASQMVSVAMSNPFFKTHVASTGQNLDAASMKQQLGGIPVTAPYTILPTAGSIAETTDPRNISKPSGEPAQLTIFYAGVVNVYNDVSPEKVSLSLSLHAQAIMFMAGNGSSTNANMTHPRARVQAPTPRQLAGDGVHGNQSHAASPCSGLSSPMSVTSHAGNQSGSGSSSTDEMIAAKTIGALAAPSSSSQLEPPKIVSLLGYAAATLVPSDVPQAPKASLARFLEKRRERVMKTAPYDLSKKSADSATPGSNSIKNSGGAGSGSLSSSNEQSRCLGPTKNEENAKNLHTMSEI
ncbi:hypothetical protein HHK36_024482 [Tetracentron sinense]|uniref:Protein TIFY n=1 Tax=Tetracentron sinense TaxID=13715 RepID=A0A834YQ06_TETSI|nr:hypothetical protein HHK36_024482 [Tetracentron sinense]